MTNSSANRKPADNKSAKGGTGKGGQNRTTKGSATTKAAAMSKSTTKPAPKKRKKPGPKPGMKRGALTAAGKPRKKPGPKPGSKRGALTAAGKPRKKPGPKPKATAPKKAATPKKVAAKSTPAKKAPIAAKPKARQIAKEAPARIPTVKAFATAPSQPPANQVQLLRARIDAVGLRMKKADADTAKRVSLLEKAYRVLDAKMDGQSPAGLTDQVALLSKKLSQVTRSANADVSATLAGALDKPSAAALTHALSQAESRLEASEAAQRASIARISQHIADMATAIDARFRRETEARDTALSEMRRETHDRIKAVEYEGVQAIKGLGEKVILIADKLGSGSGNNEAVITEKVSEIALKTQEEFEQYRSKLERRLETLEAEQRHTLAATDQAIMGLSSRIDGVEYVTSTSTPDTDTDIDIFPSEPVQFEAEENVTTLLSTEKRIHMPPSVVEDDPFAPDLYADAKATIVPPNPYAIPEPELEVEPQPDHIPAEFNPQEFAPNAYAGESQIPPPSKAAASRLNSKLDTTPIPTPEPVAVTDPVLPENNSYTAPYADPAYAEGHSGYDTAMDQARPGNFGNEKPRFSIPNISQQHLKVAGVVAVAGAIGLIGLKSFSGGDETPTSAPPYIVADNSNSGIGTNIGGIQTDSAIGVPAVIETAPTIGTYEDNTVDVAPAGSPQAVTLEAAADAGNPIAQYQLGVSFLENGRIEDAVALIRTAADNGQPAAQYRLAKLYETGEGVTQNAEMARKLTQRAARSGNRIAMHDLALYHAEGRGGVSMDLDTAAKWFEKAAERGVVDSQFNLGVMYETGKGVPKNMTDAFVWYSIAAAQGDQFATQRVKFLQDKMDPNSRTLADARIAQFKPSKIDQAANGIFKSVPWDKKSTTAPQVDGRVKDVQVMLMDLGFDTGGADGAIGPKTRTAIMSFEKANGLPETGRVNDDLVSKLEFASGA